MISFNEPFISGDEIDNLNSLLLKKEITSNGDFTTKCQSLLCEIIGTPNIFLTSSCTHALEIIALLCDIQPGDEIIMPSFTFVSSANAFVLRGAKIVFVDIRPDTMNIDEKLIKSAITKKTKAILVMHYGGVSCEMDSIIRIAQQNNLLVIEDAAHCIDAYLDNKHLGTTGHFGTLSFHSTKNIHSGEGGALIINDPRYLERADILREKGTNRRAFSQGKIDRYSWVDVGSSYLMSELNAAFLYAQIIHLKDVTKERLRIWETYFGNINEVFIQNRKPKNQHNAHLFYLKLKDKRQRTDMINYLEAKRIKTAFHYIPLHSSKAGKRFSRFHGVDEYTTVESERLLRLPLYFNLKKVDQVIEAVNSFVEKSC